MKTNLGSSLAAAAIVAFGALGAASTAEAAVYRGSWDPTFGAPFDTAGLELGWKASALFDVPNACLALGDGSHLLPSTCPGFTVLSAELDFYNASVDSDPNTSPVVESFNLNTNAQLNGFATLAGQLSGVSAIFAPVVPVGASLPLAGNGNYAFSLVLSGSQAQLAYVTPPTSPPFCQIPDGSHCGLSENAAQGTFTPVVPEPETYALMLGGLAALGAVARRRRQAA